MKRDETLFCAISDKVMHKAAFGGEREGGGVGRQSYRVALLRLGGAIHSDTIGWWCQLWHVCLDEAASVDETNERKAENIVTVSKHYTAKVTQQHNNTTRSSDRPVLL